MCMKNYDAEKIIFDKFTVFFNIVIFDHCLNTILVGSAYIVKSTPPRAFSISFLSHLLIAGCDIGVQISVRPYVRSFVRAFVRPFVRQHLRRSSVFSTSVIAASLKPCILIVLDIPFKHAP